MIVEEKSYGNEKRLESSGFIAIEGQNLLESTRNQNYSVENSTVDEERQEEIDHPALFKLISKNDPRAQCKYKRQLGRITGVLRRLNYQSKKNEVNGYKVEKGQPIADSQLDTHMILAELQQMCKQQLIFLCIEKQIKSNNNVNIHDGHTNKEEMIIPPQEPQKQMMIYQSSSENSDDFVVAIYEDKLAKYKRYIELLNLEHSEQIQKYDAKYEQKVSDMEEFFQLRENDIYFDYDLRMKEMLLEQRQKISALETRFNHKLDEKIDVYVRKLDSNQQKYVDTVQHFKNEIQYREQHVIALTRKFSTLLELKDKFTSYYESISNNNSAPPPSSLFKKRYENKDNRKNENKKTIKEPSMNIDTKHNNIEFEHVRQVLSQFFSTEDYKIKEQLLVIFSNMVDIFFEYISTHTNK